jgi:hypothetical protein
MSFKKILVSKRATFLLMVWQEKPKVCDKAGKASMKRTGFSG